MNLYIKRLTTTTKNSKGVQWKTIPLKAGFKKSPKQTNEKSHKNSNWEKHFQNSKIKLLKICSSIKVRKMLAKTVDINLFRALEITKRFQQFRIIYRREMAKSWYEEQVLWYFHLPYSHPPLKLQDRFENQNPHKPGVFKNQQPGQHWRGHSGFKLSEKPHPQRIVIL